MRIVLIRHANSPCACKKKSHPFLLHIKIGLKRPFFSRILYFCSFTYAIEREWEKIEVVLSYFNLPLNIYDWKLEFT